MRRAAALFTLVAAGAAIAAEPKTDIKSDRVRILDRGGAVEFTGNVVLERGDDRLTADRIVTRESNSIARVSGRVRMRRKLPRANVQWEAWGDEAVYDTDTSSGTIWGKNRPARAERRSSLEMPEETVMNLAARRISFFRGAAASDLPEAPAMATAAGAVHLWAEEPVLPARRTDLWADEAFYDGTADRLTLSGAYAPKRGDAPAPAEFIRPFMRQVQALDRRDLSGETLSLYPEAGRLAVEGGVRGDFVFEAAANRPSLPQR